MRPIISPTRTSVAQSVMRPKQLTSSTVKTRKPRAVGRGTAIAFSAAARNVASMAQAAKKLEMPGFVSGAGRIQRRRQAWTRGGALSRSTGLRLTMWMPCAWRRVVAAPSARAQPHAYSWITATLRGTSARCYARLATPFLDGTKRKQTPYCAFRDIWRRIARVDQPCHADTLLLLANAPLMCEAV